MMPKRVLAPAVLLLAGAVAACGGTAASPATSPGGASPDTASPAASDAASPSAAASDAAAPATGASGSPAASGGASPDASASAGASTDTAGGGGGDLAATMPETVGDIALSVSPVDPQTFIATNVNLQLTPILTALGRSASDLEVVTASGAGTTATLFINAVRIAGADATALSGAFETAAAAAPGNEVETGQVGGKDVVTVTTGSYTMSAYASGDTMYFVQSSDPALVEEGVAALP